MANKIRKDGFVPAYITDEEYDKVMEMLIGGRKLAVAKAIDNLIDLVGDQIAAKAVQEIVSGIQFYKCDKAVVITNSTFTKAAERLSRSTKVELWDGIIINKHIKSLKLKEESANYYTAKQKLVMRLLITLNNRKNELQ